MNLIEMIRQPWAWYVSGFAIACIMLLLFYFGKTFGFSSNMRTINAMCGAGKHLEFFNYNWRSETWNLFFLLGTIAGGFIAHHFLSASQAVQISQATINDLHKLGFAAPQGMEPEELYGLKQLTNTKTVILLITGGLLIGFGTRWAGGCTSGHAITGLSALQIPSLISVIGFFIGGLLMTHLLYPLIF